MRFDTRGPVRDFPADELREELDGYIATCPDIDDFPTANTLTFCGKEVRAGDIAYVRIIARNRAISEYRERPTIFLGEEERADRESIWTARVEPRTIHIEVTERHRLHAVDFRPNVTKKFSDIFLKSVRIHRIGGHRLDERQRFLHTVG